MFVLYWVFILYINGCYIGCLLGVGVLPLWDVLRFFCLAYIKRLFFSGGNFNSLLGDCLRFFPYICIVEYYIYIITFKH